MRNVNYMIIKREENLKNKNWTSCDYVACDYDWNVVDWGLSYKSAESRAIAKGCLYPTVLFASDYIKIMKELHPEKWKSIQDERKKNNLEERISTKK